ncbi:MAG: hypothetical protein ACLRMZ_25605 [Blautia marasmi]
MTIYAIPIAVLATYPLIMSKFGTVAFGSAYTALLVFLLGSANIASAAFLSNYESQVIAAVLTLYFYLLLYDEWNFFLFLRDGNVYVCDIGILIGSA